MTAGLKIASVFGLAAAGAVITPIVASTESHSGAVIASRPAIVESSPVHIFGFEEQKNDNWTSRSIDLSKWSGIADWRCY